jgi:hypothetical protein
LHLSPPYLLHPARNKANWLPRFAELPELIRCSKLGLLFVLFLLDNGFTGGIKRAVVY